MKLTLSNESQTWLSWDSFVICGICTAKLPVGLVMYHMCVNHDMKYLGDAKEYRKRFARVYVKSLPDFPSPQR